MSNRTEQPPMEIRSYQDRTVNDTMVSLMAGQLRRCIQSPTGSGKTFIMAKLLQRLQQPQIVLTERRVLLDQLANTLTSFGIEFGFRAAGHPAKPAARIQLAMAQTEWARVFRRNQWKRHPAVVVHADELHRFKQDMAQTMLGAYHKDGASIIGYTATPAAVGEVVDEVYVAATVPELLDQGYLIPPMVYGPDVPDMDRLTAVKRLLNGEYLTSELQKVWRCKYVFGRVIEYYKALNPGCPAILFAPGVAESLWYAKRLAECGIPAAHIDHKNIWMDGQQFKNDEETRAILFARLGKMEIHILCNRFIAREGLDLPSVSHIIIVTPMGTRLTWVQACGRAMRPCEGHEYCVIQDHAGNWLMHPPLDSDDPFDIMDTGAKATRNRLDGMRAGSIPEPISCSQCGAVRVQGDTCPACGFRSEQRERWVLQVDGRLQLRTGDRKSVV